MGKLHKGDAALNRAGLAAAKSLIRPRTQSLRMVNNNRSKLENDVNDGIQSLDSSINTKLTNRIGDDESMSSLIKPQTRSRQMANTNTRKQPTPPIQSNSIKLKNTIDGIQSPNLSLNIKLIIRIDNNKSQSSPMNEDPPLSTPGRRVSVVPDTEKQTTSSTTQTSEEMKENTSDDKDVQSSDKGSIRGPEEKDQELAESRTTTGNNFRRSDRQKLILIPFSTETQFCSSITETSLSKVLDNIIAAQKVFDNIQTSGDATLNDTVAIAEVCSTINQAPHSTALLKKIREIWPKVIKLSDSSTYTQQVATIRNQHIMLTNWTLWNWLEVECIRPCKAFLAGNAEHGCPIWLRNLASDMKYFLKNRLTEATLDTAQYLTDTDFPHISVEIRFQRNYALGDEGINKQVMKYVQRVLTNWLQYPITKGLQQRAKFVSMVCSRFQSPYVLVLPEMWSSYTHIARELSKTTGYNDIDWSLLSESLLAHPLSHPNSDESITLRKIGEAHAKFSASTMQSPNSFTRLESSIMSVETQDKRLQSFTDFLL